MFLSDLVAISLRQIYRKKRRYKSVLIGMALGIAGLITVLTVGDSVETDLGYNLELLGSATVVKATWDFDRTKRHHHGEYYEADVENLRRLPHARYVSPAVWSHQKLSHNQRTFGGRVMGVRGEYFDTMHIPVSRGRRILDEDEAERRNVCVAGKTIVDALLKDYDDPLGKTITAGGCRFEVVGLVGGVEDPGFLETIMIPMATARARFANMYAIRDIYVRADNWNSVEVLQQSMLDLLRSSKPGYAESVDIKYSLERIRTIQHAVLLVKLFLYAAMTVTLLLAGLGITNVMLAAVRERTTEIGLRKAVGATESTIMSQFLLEAVTLSLVGSLLGIIAGMSSIEILKHTAGTIPNYKVMLLGAGGGVAFSALLGIVSGYLPAKKAGKLDPADAMRFE